MLMITPRYHVALDDGLDNAIVVDGVPVIDKSKLDKLVAKIAKEFTKKGAALKPESIFVPWDNASGKSKGYANTILRIGSIANRPLSSYLFVDAGSADAATFAINVMHGHPFDSKHTFLVNRFTDIEQYANMDETYVEPKIEEFHPKV
jgi:translation initiation factor 3 subunit B